MFDVVLVWELRTLVYSFLLTKHNLKGARTLHRAQSHKDKFTLSYIKEYAIYPKQFNFWHKIYLLFLISILPSYGAGILVAIFNIEASVSLMILLGMIRILLTCMVGNQFNSKRISKFDKRYRDK